MAAGEVWRCAIEGGTPNNADIVTVLHFRMRTGADPIGSIQTAVSTHWLTPLKANQSFNYSASNLHITRLSVPPIGSDTPPLTATVGALAVNQPDLATALIVSWRSLTLGRSYRGRTYLPCIPQVDGSGGTYLTDGVWTTTILNAVQTWVNTWLNLYSVTGTDPDVEFGVWSRKNGDIVVGGHITGYNWSAGFVEISYNLLDAPAHTQRRRQVGVNI